MIIKTLCVFCGSSFGKSEIYRKETVELGRAMARRNIDLVYGGGAAGLMGVLAETVLEEGGRVTGVIPELIYPKVRNLPLTETIISEDMHSRKRIMYEKADAFTALPGGIGTVEEISEVYTWQQLGYHSKPVSLYNINNFFDCFIEFLKNTANEGFLKEVHRERLIIESYPEALIEKLEAYDGETIDKWS